MNSFVPSLGGDMLETPETYSTTRYHYKTKQESDNVTFQVISIKPNFIRLFIFNYFYSILYGAQQM